MSGFRAFILRGNVVDLAIGVVIGAAFTAVVTAVVSGIFTPLIGLFGDRNFDAYTLCLRDPCGVAADGTPTGNVLRWGSVLTALLNFLIVAVVLYFFVVRPVNLLMERHKTEPEPTSPTVACPQCLSKIPQAALRCAFCAAKQPQPA